MEEDQVSPVNNQQALLELVTTRMPFGKYQGRLLCDLPETYLVWFRQKGFPPGKIGYNCPPFMKLKSTDWNICSSHSRNICQRLNLILTTQYMD